MSIRLFPTALLDDSFRPERVFRWPPMEAGANEVEIASFEEARRWFNFGELEVGAGGALTMRVVSGEGEVVWEETIEPTPRDSPAKSRRSLFD